MTPFEKELISHRGALHGYAMKLLRGRRSEAEDLVQDVMVKAIAASRQFRDGTNMRAWLHTIALNTYINQRRRREVHRLATEDEPSTHWMGESTRRPSYDADATCLPAVQEEVRQMIRELPPEYATVLALVDIGGYRYAEAAQEAGCPIGTVMSRLHRGRRLLAEKVAA